MISKFKSLGYPNQIDIYDAMNKGIGVATDAYLLFLDNGEFLPGSINWDSHE
jgi:hypothetical protein